jgi:hypothetical protein
VFAAARAEQPFALLPATMLDYIKHQVKAFLVSAAAYQVGLLLGRGVRALKNRRRNRMRERHDTSSLRTPGRIVSIVTTAALPWRTGACIDHGAVFALPWSMYKHIAACMQALPSTPCCGQPTWQRTLTVR